VLQLQHPFKNVFFDEQTIFLSFSLAKDVEDWFYALEDATELTRRHAPAEVEFAAREQEFRKTLAERFRCPTSYGRAQVCSLQCWLGLISRALTGAVRVVQRHPGYVELLYASSDGHVSASILECAR
jgi:hypothetical protein